MINTQEDSTFAEQAVIGSLMHLTTPESKLMISTMAMLKPQSFYMRYHQQIFSAIKALFVKNENIDLLTVEAQCKRQGNDDHNLFIYLAESIKKTPSAENIVAYAKLVREYSVERFANQKLQDLIGMFNDRSSGDVYQRLGLVESTITSIMNLGMSDNKGGLKHISEFAGSWMDNITEIHETGYDKNKITTGIPSIDDILGVRGLVRGSLVGVGARPKMGKTAFMSLMINHIALDLKLVCPVFSQEMSGDDIFERGLSGRTTVNPAEFYKKNLRSEVEGRMDTACREYVDSKIFVDESPQVSLEHIKRESRRLRTEEGELGAIFVDYLTLMETEKAERNDLAYGAITKGLTSLSKELNCIVVLLLQLNRNLESRPDKRPIASDCKDTGQIEQDVGTLIMLYKESVYNDTVYMPGFTEAIVRLNRKGGSGTGFVEMREGFHVPMTLEEGAKILNIREQSKLDDMQEQSNKTKFKRK